MKKYVSLDKRSKKVQREYYSKQRLTWGVLNPVTRSVPSGKTYNRKKDKQERRRIDKEFRDEFYVDFLLYANSPARNIAERTPSEKREDLWELLGAVGLDYYDCFE